jgi:hypothetical protein
LRSRCEWGAPPALSCGPLMRVRMGNGQGKYKREVVRATDLRVGDILLFVGMLTLRAVIVSSRPGPRTHALTSTRPAWDRRADHARAMQKTAATSCTSSEPANGRATRSRRSWCANVTPPPDSARACSAAGRRGALRHLSQPASVAPGTGGPCACLERRLVATMVSTTAIAILHVMSSTART